MLDPARIETRYARSGDLNIAYQQFGEGGCDLVLIPGWASHVEQAWNFPEFARFLEGFARFARVLMLDRRGTGLSDPVFEMPTLEERMDDVRAVMDDAGVEHAALFGISEGGPMAMTFAATFPERTDALVLYGTFARLTADDGYPDGVPVAEATRFLNGVEERWGKGKAVRAFSPSRADDPAFVQTWARFERNCMGPGAARRLLELNFQTDVRDILSTIQAPTLVLHRTGDIPVPVSLGRYLGEHIPGARFVELPGDDHFFAVGDVDSLHAEVEHFLTGECATAEPERILATILFADIAGSTEKAAEMGDAKWKHALERHYAASRDALTRFRGREIDTAGDGLFASFDGPARAVRCGMAMRDAAASMGLPLRIGIHTGECEVLNGKLGGMAVHIGARIASHADPGEVLVSSTVKALTVGAGLSFADRGEHSLKGVPDSWQLFSASV